MYTQAIYKQNINFATNNYDDFYYDFNEEQFFGCRALWRAVIMQAIFDLTSNSSRTEERLAKSHAQSWITDGGENFYKYVVWLNMMPKLCKKKLKK